MKSSWLTHDINFDFVFVFNYETPYYRHWEKIEPDSVPVNETYQVSSARQN